MRVPSINLLALLISGLSLGWLVGLSVSPVMHLIVGGVLTLVTAAVGASESLRSLQMRGEQNASSSPRQTYSAVPLALVLIGIAVGSSVGLFARSNDWFAPTVERFSRRWNNTGFGGPYLAQRLFQELHPAIRYDQSAP